MVPSSQMKELGSTAVPYWASVALNVAAIGTNPAKKESGTSRAGSPHDRLIRASYLRQVP